MNQIIEAITRLKSESADSIKQQQLSSIPYYDDEMYSHQVYEYLDDGNRTLINQEREICIRLNYIRMKFMNKQKLLQFNDSELFIPELVENEYIYPFLLFINGKFIPWNSIRLVVKQEKYYLVIRPVNKADMDSIAIVTTLNIITIPFNVSYWEGYAASITPETIFAFDANGYTTLTTPYVSIINMDENTYFNEWVSSVAVDAFPIPVNKSFKLYPENIIIFKNGSPSKSSVAKFSSTLLSIDGGKNTSADSINFKLFYNTKCNLSNDNIAATNLNFLQPQVKARNAGTAYNPQLENIEKPFNFSLDKNKKYEENVSAAIVNIMKYNSDLFNDVYIKNSNLEIATFTGQEIISMAGADGCLTIPRGHNEVSDYYIIMLVNGELYKHYYTHKYIADKFSLTVLDILPADVVEILTFKNVNNNTFNITVPAGAGYMPVNESVINSGMLLFSPENNGTYFDFPANGDQNFPVDYTLEKDAVGNTKIILADPFYNGKPLTVAYNNQFRYFWYKIKDPKNELRISLETNFYYCPDYAKFMVFYNGRRLGSDQYRLTLPARTTTPFFRYEIYLTLPVKTGDRLDVFYLPSLMKDVAMYPSIPVSGNIVIDTTKISYNFNKDLYMIWVNGKKIPASHLANISSTRLRIITDEHSVHTVCATKYIADIDYLSPIFKGNDAIWDTIIANLTDAEIYLLLNIMGVDISDTEASIYKDSLPVASIMWELIREHYMSNPSVDIADGFVYDYQDVDNTAIEGYDLSGNAILPAADANRHDNIEPIVRNYL